MVGLLDSLLVALDFPELAVDYFLVALDLPVLAVDSFLFSLLLPVSAFVSVCVALVLALDLYLFGFAAKHLENPCENYEHTQDSFSMQPGDNKDFLMMVSLRPYPLGTPTQLVVRGGLGQFVECGFFDESISL